MEKAIITLTLTAMLGFLIAPAIGHGNAAPFEARRYWRELAEKQAEPKSPHPESTQNTNLATAQQAEQNTAPHTPSKASESNKGCQVSLIGTSSFSVPSCILLFLLGS